MTADESLKAQVMKEVEEALEAMLKISPAGTEITLSEIEQLVGQVLGRVQGELMQALVSRVEEKADEQRVTCAECGHVMSNKGQHKKVIDTEHGKVEVARRYLYCETCERGFFPPG